MRPFLIFLLLLNLMASKESFERINLKSTPNTLMRLTIAESYIMAKD